MKKIILLLSCEENNLWVFGSDTSIPVYDVAKTLLSDLEKNMDLRIRLFFVNLGNILKEIIYIHLSASLKLLKVQSLNQRPNRNQSLHDLFTKPCICSVCLEKRLKIQFQISI